MNAKRLICVGGDNDQKSIVLEMGANRVIFARHTSSTCWYGHDTETILPDSDEYTIRRINFPDDKFVEVLGLSSLSDFEVFDLLVHPHSLTT